MTKIDDLTRLKHMLQAAAEALEFIQGYSRESLERDRKLILSLVKEIEILGESAVQPSPQCRRHPQIPWKDIIGMRNRLIHAYHDADLNILWNTVTLALEPLIIELENIITLET